MRITPLDIQQKQFTSKFRGLDIEEVDSFLELLREEMEELLRENANLRDESKRFEKQQKEYKSIENTLKDTLIATQKMVEEYQANALKEAELIRREAEARIPTEHAGPFKAVIYTNSVDNHEHIALVKGDISKVDRVLVRVHSECLTGDVFGSSRCDCGLFIREIRSFSCWARFG